MGLVASDNPDGPSVGSNDPQDRNLLSYGLWRLVVRHLSVVDSFITYASLFVSGSTKLASYKADKPGNNSLTLLAVSWLAPPLMLGCWVEPMLRLQASTVAPNMT